MIVIVQISKGDIFKGGPAADAIVSELNVYSPPLPNGFPYVLSTEIYVPQPWGYFYCMHN